MKSVSVFGIVAVVCASLIGATPSNTDKKCITKSEATAFIKDFGSVWGRTASNWKDIAVKIATPDFVLKSGSIAAIHDDIVGSDYPVIFSSRTDWIDFLASHPPPGAITTLHINVADCTDIIWQTKTVDPYGYVFGFERFYLKSVKGKWQMYLTEVEYDSLTAVGGYPGCEAQE